MIDWLPELQLQVLSGLSSSPAWWAVDPYDSAGLEALHLLRREIKGARYGLLNLDPLCGNRLDAWLRRFKGLQSVLGDLNDLHLLDIALVRQLDVSPDQLVPCLCSLLAEARAQAWDRWLSLSSPLRSPLGRADLHRLTLAGLDATPTPAALTNP